MRRTGGILIALGVLVILGALVLRFGVAPRSTRLPSDTDTATTYSGTGSLLNAGALQSGNVAGAIARNVPVTLDRHVYVSQTSGNTAIVHDDLTLKAQAGSFDDKHTYSVDRTKLTEAPPIGGVQVENHTGLTVSLPAYPDPKSHVYHYWDPATRIAVPVRYEGEAQKEGRKTFHYEAQASGALADTALQQQLPASIPRALAPRLLPLLPAETQQRIAPLVSSLPADIPLTYTVTSRYDVWADAKLGVPIDSKINRQIVANVSAVNIPLIPVLSIDVTEDQASVKSAADDASKAASRLKWLRTWIPILGLILGIVLIGFGSSMRRRRPPPATTVELPNTVGRPTPYGNG